MMKGTKNKIKKMGKGEIKLIKDFKDTQIEIEDYFLTVASDKILDFVDKKGQEKYNLMHDLIKKLKEIMSKMIDFESYELNMEEYEKTYYEIAYLKVEAEEYFNKEGEFVPDMTDEIIIQTLPNLGKLQQLITKGKIIGYSKTVNNLRFENKKFVERIQYIINMSFRETAREYMNNIYDLINNVQEITNAKADIYDELKKLNTTEEIKKQKMKKILDCDVMDDLLLESGYEPIRQNGSHLIYSDGVNSIPVPQHGTLNKGLGYEIQKQILNNEEE